MKIVVGHTGFVGSNLEAQTHFDGLYNSRNIQEAFGTKPNILVYSGVRAEKFLANSEPEKDLAIIEDAIENIRKINPEKVILISTVDVYPTPVEVDENSEIDLEKVQPYGKNRLILEQWVEANFEDHLIVRLPALFGKNLKKNFIYDLIHLIPAMLNEEKFASLSEKEPVLADYYTKQENGFYKVRALSPDERKTLKKIFLEIGFSALNFTDSRGRFQFYDLENIWADIETAIQNKIKKINFATEPISVNEIHEAVLGKPYLNEITSSAPLYDLRTVHGAIYGSHNDYMRSKSQISGDIVHFIKEATAQ